jgi:hypothetical protein
MPSFLETEEKLIQVVGWATINWVAMHIRRVIDYSKKA